MIVVDSSVWVDHFRSRDTDAVRKLRALAESGEILAGDVILLEVLRGARNDQHAARIERELTQFPIPIMLGPLLARRAAENYRKLRERGVTVRKSADIVIETFCIAGGHQLLHADPDFDPMAKYLGLKLA